MYIKIRNDGVTVAYTNKDATRRDSYSSQFIVVVKSTRPSAALRGGCPIN